MKHILVLLISLDNNSLQYYRAPKLVTSLSVAQV